MKEASGELSMTLIVIIAAGVIVMIFAAFWPQIQDFINQKWTQFDGQAGTPMIVTHGSIEIPGYSVVLGK
ncbi:MAG: hypothetical protein IJ068_01185 [Bacilli bacterium]|nr:hypothetical protein [Bacilli bacterium]